MKTLIAVKSCRQDRDRDYHEVIRGTWGQDVINADLHFFMGNGNGILLANQRDEVSVNCPDDYASLPFKTREILRWSIENNYDFTFLCDTDSFIILQNLLRSGFEKYDYYGVIRKPLGKTFVYESIDREKRHTWVGECYPWASGGLGYFLSRKAAEIIIQREPDIWAEDLWIGQILGPLYEAGEIKSGDASQMIRIGDAKNLEGVATWHFPSYTYKSGYDLKFKWMEGMYAEHR